MNARTAAPQAPAAAPVPAAAAPAPTLEEVRGLARTRGAAAALTALARVTPAACAPGGYVLLPDDLAPPRGAVRVTSVATPEDPLTVWHVPRGVDASGPPAATATGATGTDDLAWRTGVAWVRLGLAERLLEMATDRLRGRSVAGTATVDLPPVRLAVAEAVTAHVTARILLSAPRATTLATVTALLDGSGRTVLNLFGASGYLDDTPGRLACAAELLGHASGTASPAHAHPVADERAS